MYTIVRERMLHHMAEGVIIYIVLLYGRLYRELVREWLRVYKKFKRHDRVD